MVEVITKEWRDEKLPDEEIMVNPGWFHDFVRILELSSIF